jgi:hypothetical protein
VKKQLREAAVVSRDLMFGSSAFKAAVASVKDEMSEMTLKVEEVV